MKGDGLNMENVKNSVVSVVATALGMNSEEIMEIGVDADLTSYELDSIKVIQIIALLEDQFDIEFDFEDIAIENFSTINKGIETITKYLRR